MPWCRIFFSRYDEFLGSGFGMIRAEYLTRCRLLGTAMEIRRGNDTLRGLAHGLTDQGALEIMTAAGVIQPVDLGEMFEAIS